MCLAAGAALSRLYDSFAHLEEEKNSQSRWLDEVCTVCNLCAY